MEVRTLAIRIPLELWRSVTDSLKLKAKMPGTKELEDFADTINTPIFAPKSGADGRGDFEFLIWNGILFYAMKPATP